MGLRSARIRHCRATGHQVKGEKRDRRSSPRDEQGPTQPARHPPDPAGGIAGADSYDCFVHEIQVP
jgi:hypothetical protein